MTGSRDYTAKRPTGHTLLELVAASVLLAVALVPALGLIRDSVEVSRQMDTRNLLTTFCVSKLEQHLALTSAAWDTTTVTGTLAAEGYANLRFRVDRSDAALDGGIPDRLMAITVTVWDDADGNAALDSGERSTTFGSKTAKLATYEDEASSS